MRYLVISYPFYFNNMRTNNKELDSELESFFKFTLYSKLNNKTNNSAVWQPTGSPIKSDSLYYMKVFEDLIIDENGTLDTINELFNTLDEDNHLIAYKMLRTLKLKDVEYGRMENSF